MSKATSTTITLKAPITVGGTEVSSISIRRPNMNDVFAADVELLQPDKLTTKQLNKLIANLAMLTPEEAGSMIPSDWQKAAKVVTDFLS